MNPEIPTKRCFMCYKKTNETQSVYGVMHKDCYDRAEELLRTADSKLKSRDMPMSAGIAKMLRKMEEIEENRCRMAKAGYGFDFDEPVSGRDLWHGKITIGRHN